MKCVLVDCFDTVFHRACSNESTLFDWAREMSRFVGYKVSSFEFYNCRKMAEKNIKKRTGKEDASYQDIIKQVYGEFQSTIKYNYLEFYNYSYNADLNSENNQLYVDVKVIEELAKKKKAGNFIVLLTDFYMPKCFFENILDMFNIRYLFDDIVVSSEIGLRKSTGNLYKYVIDKYGFNVKNMLMIGDNRLSDFERPKQLGIKAKLVNYKNGNKIIKSYDKLTKDLKKQLVVYSENELFSGFNSGVLVFCKRLYDLAIADGCKKLYFCAREGQFLRKLFDVYQDQFCYAHRIKTEYLYVSRKSTLVPCLKKLEDEDFNHVFRQYRELSTHDFLSTIGFTSEEINHLQPELGGDTISKDSDTMNRLRLSRYFQDIYEKNRTRAKNAIKKYFAQLNGAIDNVFIVDIGWKGTIQDNLFGALDEKCTIHGYYFGLFRYASSSQNIKVGVMFDLEKKKKNNTVFAYNHIKLESVFVADHASVQKYDYIGDIVEPVISPEKNSTYDLVYSKQVIMKETFENTCKMIRNSPFDIQMLEPFFAKEYLQFQCLNMPKYRYVFDSIINSTTENFGNISHDKKIGREINSDIPRRLNREYCYLFEVYKVLGQLHMKCLYPVAAVYCRIIYFYKKCGVLGKCNQ